MKQENLDGVNRMAAQIARMRYSMAPGTGEGVNDADRKLAEKVYILLGKNPATEEVPLSFGLGHDDTYALFLNIISSYVIEQVENNPAVPGKGKGKGKDAANAKG